jgi:hypothetical protein
MDTVVPINIEVLAKYPLSQNDRIVVFENCLPAKALSSSHQHCMANEML